MFECTIFARNINLWYLWGVLFAIFFEEFLCCTAQKISKYRLFSGPYFPVYGQNTEIYSLFTPNKENTDQKKLWIWTPFTLFKPGQIIRLKRRYVGQSDFQTEHQTKLFFEETQDIKSLANNLELLCLDKYKT